MTARYCSLAQAPAPAFAPGLAAERLSALAGGRRRWVNGTVLHYWFFDGDTDASVIPVPGRGMTRRVSWAGAEEQREVVRSCFREWQDLGIGIAFAEVDDRSEAELRIGFQAGDGSWSTVGRDALLAGRQERTMNFGWDLTAPGERGTALHQIGHALGMLHEHQSPFAGIHWDDEAVHAELAGPPHHWSRERTHYNILRKLDPDEANGSFWDPQSIMEFPFAPGLILEPEQYRGGLNPPGTLSAADKESVLRWYPPAHPLGSPALVPFGAARARSGRTGGLRDRPAGDPYVHAGGLRRLRRRRRALRGAGRAAPLPRRPGRRGDRAQRHDRRRPARQGPPLCRPRTSVLRLGERRGGGDVLVTAHIRRADT